MKLLVLMLLLFSFRSFADEVTTISLSCQENYTDIPVVEDITKFISESLEKEKIKVNFVPLPLMRGTISAERGEVDGEMARDKESMKSFSQLITTTRPLLFVKVKFIYLKSNRTLSLNNLSRFQAVTLLNNQTIIRKLQEDHLRFIEAKDIPQALTLLKQKRVDYFLLSEVVALGVLDNDPKLKEKFEVSDQNFMIMPLYLTLNKKKADLMPRIEKALRAGIKSDLRKYPRIEKRINKDF